MFDYFIQFNIKILLVLVVFGFLMGRARQSAWQNFSRNARGYFCRIFLISSVRRFMNCRTLFLR